MATWILLRGLTRESRHWGDFPERLARALPGAAIHPIDLPGNGRLHRERSPASVPAMAAQVRQQALALGLMPPFHVLAMSLGAMVAVAWAERWPREVAAAVLINTSLRPFSPWHQRLRPANLPRLLTLALGNPSSATWEAAILRMTSRQAGDTGALLSRWIAWREEAPVSTANALRQLLAAARYRAPAAPPIAQLLLLSSQADALVDARCSAALATAWGAEHIAHPNAGHDLPLDDGGWVAEQVQRWTAGRRDRITAATSPRPTP